MARSDLLLGLVKAGIQGDRSLIHRTVYAIIAEERGKQHHVLADQLEDTLRKNRKTPTSQPILSNGTHQALLHETVPQRSMSDLGLPAAIRQACQEVVEEQHRADLLRAHSVEPRHRVGRASKKRTVKRADLVSCFRVRNWTATGRPERCVSAGGYRTIRCSRRSVPQHFQWNEHD